MRIKTEIYRAPDGKMWKVIREGEDVINVPTTIWNFVSQFNIDGPKD